MDLMEEFEFKPLTEGLGFHKKKLEDKPSSSDVSLPELSFAPRETLSAKSSQSFAETHFTTEEKKKELEEKVSHLPYDRHQTIPTLFSTTLPRETTEPLRAKVGASSTPVSARSEPREKISIPKLYAPKLKSTDKNVEAFRQAELLKTAKQETALETESVPNKITVQKSEPVFKPSYSQMTSVFLDFFVVLGLAVLFTLALILTTGLDIISIATQSLNDLGTQVGIGLLLYSVTQLYMILARSFFGQTLGEWSVEQQLGTPEEQNKFSYVFKLLLRTLLISFTGFLILPLISTLARKDITGKLCGIKIYRKEA